MQPALIATEAFQSALIDEETGLRGFLLTGRENFLEPFARGTASSKANGARLDTALTDSELERARPELRSIWAVAGRRWASYAVPQQEPGYLPTDS